MHPSLLITAVPDRMFPVWLDTRDPEAVRGTTRVRTVDPNLIVGRDLREGRRGELMIWGPRYETGGWAPLTDVQDDRGRPFLQAVPWELIVTALLRGRQGGENAADKVAAHNARVEASRKEQQSTLVREGAKYFSQAIAQGRWKPQDVVDGWHGKLKATPQGVKHFGPGMRACGEGAG